jgi:hypothetical protein
MNNDGTAHEVNKAVVSVTASTWSTVSCRNATERQIWPQYAGTSCPHKFCGELLPTAPWTLRSVAQGASSGKGPMISKSLFKQTLGAALLLLSGCDVARNARSDLARLTSSDPLHPSRPAVSAAAKPAAKAAPPKADATMTTRGTATASASDPPGARRRPGYPHRQERGRPAHPARPADKRGGPCAGQDLALPRRTVQRRHPALSGCPDPAVWNSCVRGEEQ